MSASKLKPPTTRAEWEVLPLLELPAGGLRDPGRRVIFSKVDFVIRPTKDAPPMKRGEGMPWAIVREGLSGDDRCVRLDLRLSRWASAILGLEILAQAMLGSSTLPQEFAVKVVTKYDMAFVDPTPLTSDFPLVLP